MSDQPLLTIHHCFADLDDPRRAHLQRHRLLDIVVIAIAATICGADSWVEIEEWGTARQDWLQTILVLPNGIPSHDTFGRVFAVLDPDQFRQGFLAWVAVIQQQTHGEIIAIDGKTLGGSHVAARGKAALRPVMAVAKSVPCHGRH
jgi:hypothetical protein